MGSTVRGYRLSGLLAKGASRLYDGKVAGRDRV